MNNTTESLEGLPASDGSLMTVEEGRNAIMEKMRRERPTLREFLESRMRGHAKAEKQWRAAGDEKTADHHNGAWHATHAVQYALDHGGFNSENAEMTSTPTNAETP